MPKVKAEKKVGKKVTAIKPEKTAGLSVPVYSIDGKEAGTLSLPKGIFGTKVNKVLLAQALRVYTNNLKGHFSNTKTRSEVAGSTRKIYKQKGTGGARHGAKTAPIFVGGGIALGPKFRKTNLELPIKMKKVALLSALSSKAAEGEVIGIQGLEKASGKTSQMREFLNKTGKKKVLFILTESNENAARAVKNLPGVGALSAEQINILDIIKHRTLVLTQEAVKKLELRMGSEPTEKK